MSLLITSVDGLIDLAQKKKSVVISCYRGLKTYPASFVLNWPAGIIHKLIQNQYIFKYEKSKATNLYGKKGVNHD